MEAAPAVVFRCSYEAALYRVAMDVADLFDALLFRVDVEVVIAELPELFLVRMLQFAG